MTIKFLRAQNGDCSLISYTDDEGFARNIIIDAGMSATYFDSQTNSYGDLKAEIDQIKAREENIDHLILTHIDNDHICGFLQLFQMDPEVSIIIKKVWFNSGKLISEKIKEKTNKALSITMQKPGIVNTGVNEGIDFEDFLIRHDFWERSLIFCGQVHNMYGAKFEILGPTILQLKTLLKEYHDEKQEDVYTGAEGKDWGTDIATFIQEEGPEYRFSQDRSVKNGSSISFILTLMGKKFVFLGDSHPVALTKALADLGYNKGKPLAVEFIKVSHHGSKANTNKEFLEVIETDHYMISTDSSSHGHPHKRTLSRILKRNPDAIFHFNYDFVRDGVFSKTDREHYNIRARVTPFVEYKP